MKAWFLRHADALLLIGATSGLCLFIVVKVIPDARAARLADHANVVVQSVTPAGWVYTVRHDGHLWVTSSGAIAHHPDCGCGR